MLSDEGYGLLPVTDIGRDEWLADFDCGTPSLNEFLVKTARDYHERRLGMTSIVLHEHHQGIVGYFTLSTDGLRLKESERFGLGIDHDVALDYIPSVTVGRLAVAKELQGAGVGGKIMQFVRGEAIKAPARLLVVDAIDSVVAYYEKQGFQVALFAAGRKGESSRTTKMWLDLIT